MIQGGGQRGFQACVSLHRYDTIRYDDPDHRPDPGVRNPHSLDYRKSYQRILMKFYRELGYVWPTDQLITFWWRSASLIHYPGPGSTATLSTYRTDALQKSFSNSIILVFGGGLCSLSASSSHCDDSRTRGGCAHTNTLSSF